MKSGNIGTINKVQNQKSVLSVLWVFVLMNMIYADILGTLKPGYLSELKHIGETLSGSTVLVFALLMEIPIGMILLSRILKRRANRIVNFIAVPISILWVIVPSIIMENNNTPLSYVFIATIETITMIFIFWYSWNWKKDEV